MVGGMEADARAAAQHYYQGSGRSLQADVAALLHNPTGVVIYTPRLVVLAKPVLRRESAHWELLHEQPPGADAWYVHLLAGDVAWARRLAVATVAPLPWVCFRRGLRSAQPHVCAWQSLLLHHNQQH